MKLERLKLERLCNFIDEIEYQTYPEIPTELHTTLSKNILTSVFKNNPDYKNFNILDIGCGQGVALEIFKELGCSKLTGIALNKEDVEVCSKKGFNVLQMDQSFLDFSDKEFDFIWCRHCIEHSIFPLFTLNEFSRVLNNKGILYIEVPLPSTCAHHEQNPNHYSVFNVDSWKAIFAKSNYSILGESVLPIDLTIGQDKYWGCMLEKNKES